MTTRPAPATQPLVRTLGPDDWRPWRDIRLAALAADPDAFGATLERERTFDEAKWRSRLDGSGGPAVLATADGEPVAMGAGHSYQPGSLMVVAMWTRPEWRGRGLGGQVLDRVVAWARERDLATDLWVAEQNPAARALYERRGFRATGEVAPLREGSALTMHRLALGRA